MQLKVFSPHKIVDHICEIPPEFLHSKGITTVLLDLDNTLTNWNSNEVDIRVRNWLDKLKEKGIKPCIVSNNNQPRIQKVAEILEVPYVHRAAKPRKSAYRKALEVMDALPEEAIFVGDQLFTDVFGANRMKIYSVLVKPLHHREFLGTKVMRRFEKIIMKYVVPRSPKDF